MQQQVNQGSDPLKRASAHMVGQSFSDIAREEMKNMADEHGVFKCSDMIDRLKARAGVTHSTGHESRLKRPEVVKAERFGTESYAVEELTAELTAAYCCTASGLDTATIKPAASYLASWLRVLKAEPRLLLTASGRAQKAFDYIAGTTPEADA